MPVNRRTFLQATGSSLLASGLSFHALAGEADKPRYRALAFDAFPIFDPRPIGAEVEAVFPGRGAEVMDGWRTRLFEYQWLRALAGQYEDFLHAAEASLLFTVRRLELELGEDSKRRLMGAWTNLQIWPDVPEALSRLQEVGLRLCFLSNMTAAMLSGGLERAGLHNHFERIISTDEGRCYKPDPRAYALGVERMQLGREEILFVAFAGWDVAGAKWFGYPSFWVNRLGSPMEELEVEADGAGSDLNALVEFVLTEQATTPA